jgi:hypothetical protein
VFVTPPLLHSPHAPNIGSERRDRMKKIRTGIKAGTRYALAGGT